MAISQNNHGVYNVQEQVQQLQIALETKLDQLLQHWNMQHKLSFVSKKEVCHKINLVIGDGLPFFFLSSFGFVSNELHSKKWLMM